MRLGNLFFAQFLLAALVGATLVSPAGAENDPAASSLEVRATAAFNRGEYERALPMLEKLYQELRDQPDRAGRVAEQIRVCRVQLASGSPSDGNADAPAGERVPHKPLEPDEIRELEIKDLGNFDYDADEGGNIPEDVIALSGGKLRIRGFMIPLDQADKITQFALVPSLFACCFGQPPQLQHTIVCNTPAGKSVAYYPDEIVVEGTLKVEEKKDEGFIVSIFELDVISVRPAR